MGLASICWLQRFNQPEFNLWHKPRILRCPQCMCMHEGVSNHSWAETSWSLAEDSRPEGTV